MLENPMTIHAEAPERRGDWICPHCGAQWQRDVDPDGDVRYDNGDYTVSEDDLKGNGCCWACATVFDTEENRRRYVRDRSLSAEVVSAMLGTSSGAAVTKIYFYNLMAANDEDTLDGCLMSFLKGPYEDGYRRWLLDGEGT